MYLVSCIVENLGVVMLDKGVPVWYNTGVKLIHERHKIMKTSLTPGKVTNRTKHAVVASFTNGFAQHVIELDDGTVLFISYNCDEVTIETREPITDPQQIVNIVNSTKEDSDDEA